MRPTAVAAGGVGSNGVRRMAGVATIDAASAMSERAGVLLEEAEANVLTYLDFPAEHRRRMRTNNLQERMSREIERRSRMVQVFPSAESMGRLSEPAAPEPPESKESRRRDLMVVETAMELADCGRSAA